MKYMCLGYIEPGTFEGMTENERHGVLDKCFEHNEHLRANGHDDEGERAAAAKGYLAMRSATRERMLGGLAGGFFGFPLCAIARPSASGFALQLFTPLKAKSGCIPQQQIPVIFGNLGNSGNSSSLFPKPAPGGIISV